MLKIKNVQLIELTDWDQLVSETYGRPYMFQQQGDCRERGTFNISVPSGDTDDDDMNDSIPEEVNGRVRGVKFQKMA